MSVVECRGDSHEHVLELRIVVIGHFSLKLKVAILVAIQRGGVRFFFDGSIEKSGKRWKHRTWERGMVNGEGLILQWAQS